VAGYFVWQSFFSGPEVPPEIVTVSGRIEGDESAVAPKTSGRILEIAFREGDRVRAGDIIARLDDEQIRARVQQAQAFVAQADARVRAARQQVAVLEQQLRQTEIQTEQARLDARGQVSRAAADVAAAEAELARQQAAYELAAHDREAYAKLAKTGAASERQAREAATNAATLAAAVQAAQRRVEAAQAAVHTAEATLANPTVRQAQAAAVRQQIAQAQAEIASAQADAARARAQLAEAEANRGDLVVTAPFEGTVATRTAEPGEVVTAGTPLITLVDLSQVYLRGFVPQGEIGRVAVGQPARVYLDSAPARAIEATVTRIDPEATFTPENTYFREDRVKQVVGVKLQLRGATGFAKPGMPADGEILVDGNEWPRGSRASR
jgi:HlyD family secretion protein